MLSPYIVVILVSFCVDTLCVWCLMESFMVLPIHYALLTLICVGSLCVNSLCAWCHYALTLICCVEPPVLLSPCIVVILVSFCVDTLCAWCLMESLYGTPYTLCVVLTLICVGSLCVITLGAWCHYALTLRFTCVESMHCLVVVWILLCNDIASHIKSICFCSVGISVIVSYMSLACWQK